ncbi:hypothetical protein ACFE04_008892 [Oxalis oulophora]
MKRMSSLKQRMHHHHTTRTSYPDQDNEDYHFESGVISGINYGTAEFLVEVQIGTPPITQHLIVDTGSDPSWFQCGPCLHCYQQTDPIIDWSSTSSLPLMDCDTRACDHWFLGYSSCDSYMWINNQCGFKVQYDDKSYAKGMVVTETIGMGGLVFKEVVMGCANDNGGSLIGASGILGLGGGHSFLEQLGHQASRRYVQLLSQTHRRQLPPFIPRVPGIQEMDTCFDLSMIKTMQIPTISFYFSSGNILVLSSQNILIRLDPTVLHYCLAFAPSSQFSVIGNVQMKDLVITYDVLNSRVGFTANASPKYQQTFASDCRNLTRPWHDSIGAQPPLDHRTTTLTSTRAPPTTMVVVRVI